MESWIRTSNFVPFAVNGLIKGEIEKPSGQYLGLICDESLASRGLNLNLGHSNGSTILSSSCGESCLLVSWGAVAGVTWRAALRIMTGVGDLVQKTGDGQAQVRYSVAG
jgi:hypothetical protein